MTRFIIWYKFAMKVEVTRTLKKIVQMRYEDGVLKVVANRFLSDKRLKQIIDENTEWIRARKQDDKGKSTAASASQSRRSQPSTVATMVVDKKDVSPRQNSNRDDVDLRDIFSGRKTLVLGDVVNVLATASPRTILDENTLYVPEKYFQNRELRIKAIKSYLRKMATLYVSNEISTFGSKISLCPARIEFREVADAWLKCSQASQRILTLDYRVVQLPQALRQYVIAHAFAHFFHPIHDNRFWDCVSGVLPRYQDYARQLENYRYLKDI